MHVCHHCAGAMLISVWSSFSARAAKVSPRLKRTVPCPPHLHTPTRSPLLPVHLHVAPQALDHLGLAVHPKHHTPSIPFPLDSLLSQCPSVWQALLQPHCFWEAFEGHPALRPSLLWTLRVHRAWPASLAVSTCCCTVSSSRASAPPEPPAGPYEGLKYWV